MPLDGNGQIVSANLLDPDKLKRLANPPHIHFTHLDWIPPQALLDSEANFALIENGEPSAMLCVLPETGSFAWLRFFYSVQTGNHQRYFSKLLSLASDWLRGKGVNHLYGLATQEWVETLSIVNGFKPCSRLISLNLSSWVSSLQEPINELTIQKINVRDFPAITELDHLCFSEPWQLHPLSLSYCLRTADYASFIAYEGRPIAYQVSHQLFGQVHISRLAVHPDHRGQGLGKRLLWDLFEAFTIKGETVFSVNTQSDNLASISLYQSLGFTIEERSLPVYQLKLT